MKQVRYNYRDGQTQATIYLGMAATLSQVRQIIIDNYEWVDLVSGRFYWGMEIVAA